MSTICSIDFIRETKESAIVRKNMSWSSSGCETAASMRFESVVTSRRRRRHRLLVAVAANYRSLIGASSGPQRGRIRPHKPETPRAAPHLSTDSTDTPPPKAAPSYSTDSTRPPRASEPAQTSRSYGLPTPGNLRARRVKKCPAADRACKSRGPRELRVKARPTRAASSDRFRNPNEANHRRRRRAAALPPSAMPFDSAPP